MNIGIDGRLWHESGVGRYIRNLVIGLENTNSKNTFTIFLNKKAYNEVQFKNSNFKKVESDILWHTLSEQLRFKKIIDQEKLDLMHFPYFSYPVFYNKPFVITIHDLIIDHYPTGVASSHSLPFYYAKHFAYKQIIKKAVKNSAKIIAPSYATKKELISHYDTDGSKIEVVYEGFDPNITDKNERKNLVSKNYILYVGNAYPHKNLRNLILAYNILKKDMQIDLVCIGKDDFFYKKFENDKNPGIHFMHNVDDSTLFDYYTNAKLLVVPSLMEGFGLPIIEAMSLSCPVVSSKTDALLEIGGDACYYFDPENVTEIANSVNKVLANKSISSDLVKKGLIRCKQFSWKDTVDKTLKIYESCNSLRQS